MLLSPAQRPLATSSLVVRDEEIAGSNPVTPTSISVGQRPAAPCDKVHEVANVSDLLAGFCESTHIVVRSRELGCGTSLNSVPRPLAGRLPGHRRYFSDLAPVLAALLRR